MNDEERIAAAEEHIMRLQHDQQQLDEVIRTQADTIDQLLRRQDQLEQRLARLEPGES